MIKSATMSRCGGYRYILRREWDSSLPPFVIGMLNPSTADHEKDDPTIRRVVGFARREGCGSVVVWNVGAGRSSHPDEWLKMEDPVGPENYRHVREALIEGLDRNGLMVAAWGQRAPDRFIVDYQVMCVEIGADLLCLGRTADGSPRHPLYVKSDRRLEPFWTFGKAF